MLIIIIVLWLSITINYFSPMAESAKEMKWWENIALLIIIFIGAPLLFVAQAIQVLLECLLPEGWGDDDKCG